MSPTPEDKDRQDSTGGADERGAARPTEGTGAGVSEGANERAAQRQTRSPQSRSGSAFSKEFSEAVGRTIKVIRTDLGIERKELAEQVGISYSYLTEIENGNKPASSTVLRPIAHALGMRLSQLTEAAESRIEAYEQPSLALEMPDAVEMRSEAQRAPSRAMEYRLMSQVSAPMRPSLRGQYRDLREAILELERLVERMAPDDIERLLDYARRLSR